MFRGAEKGYDSIRGSSEPGFNMAMTMMMGDSVYLRE